MPVEPPTSVHEIWKAQRKLAGRCTCDMCFDLYLASIEPTYSALVREAEEAAREKVA